MFIIRVAISIPITLTPITLTMFWVILASLISVAVSTSRPNHARRESGETGHKKKMSCKNYWFHLIRPTVRMVGENRNFELVDGFEYAAVQVHEFLIRSRLSMYRRSRSGCPGLYDCARLGEFRESSVADAPMRACSHRSAARLRTMNILATGRIGRYIPHGLRCDIGQTQPLCP